MRRYEARMALVTLLIAAGASAASGDRGELFDVVPPDATAVAVVRWSELRATPLYRQFEERCLFDHGRADFDDFIRVTGVDPEKDVDEMLVAFRSLGKGGPQGAVGLVRGRFDEAALAKRMLSLGAPLDRREKNGVSLYVFQEGQRSGSQVIAFPARGVAVFGDEASVVATVLAVRSGKGGPPADSGLRAAFDGGRHQGQFWGALEIDPVLRRSLDGIDKKPAPLQAISSLRWLSFDADFGADLRMTASGLATSAEDAELVRQSLDGILAFAKLGAKEDLDLLTMLAEVAIERRGERLTVTTTLPGQFLLKHLPERDGAIEPAASERTR